MRLEREFLYKIETLKYDDILCRSISEECFKFLLEFKIACEIRYE